MQTFPAEGNFLGQLLRQSNHREINQINTENGTILLAARTIFINSLSFSGAHWYMSLFSASLVDLSSSTHFIDLVAISEIKLGHQLLVPITLKFWHRVSLVSACPILIFPSEFSQRFPKSSSSHGGLFYCPVICDPLVRPIASPLVTAQKSIFTQIIGLLCPVLLSGL